MIWNPDGKVPADVGASGGDNTVYTEFQQSGDLVQYADRGGWHGRVALWRSRLGELNLERLPSSSTVHASNA